MNRLDQVDTYRLLLLVAPEDTGKTLRLSAWVSQQAGRNGILVAWFALEQSHNQPENFLSGLDQALLVAKPKIDNQSGPLPSYLYAGATESLEGKALEDALIERINHLAEAAGKLILVLDNYEAITSAEVHQMVGMLLDYLPPQALVVISSACDPPLPLARLRVRRQLLELSVADLDL